MDVEATGIDSLSVNSIGVGTSCSGTDVDVEATGIALSHCKIASAGDAGMGGAVVAVRLGAFLGDLCLTSGASG